MLEEHTALSEIDEQLIKAVDAEIKAEFFPRHNLNKLSPSYPHNHRTLANRQSMARRSHEIFVEHTMIGGRCFISKKSLLATLRAELAAKKTRL